MALPDLCEFGADRAPGLAGAGLGDADDDEREEADEDVGADAVVAAVEDGAEQERALEVAERPFGLEQLLVAERDVLGTQGRVGGGEQVLAVEVLLPGDLVVVEQEPAGLGLADVAGEGRVVAERALAPLVGVPFGLGLGAFALQLEPVELGRDPVELLLAARLGILSDPTTQANRSCVV